MNTHAVKNIIFYTKFPPDLNKKSHGGGIARYLFYASTVLCDRFQNIYIISCSKKVSSSNLGNIKGVYIGGSSLIRFFKRFQTTALLFRTLSNLIEAYLVRVWIKRNSKLVQASYFEFEDIEFPSLFVPTGTNYGVRLHGSYLSLNVFFSKTFGRKMLAYFDKLNLLKSRKINSPSKYQLDEMIKLGAIHKETPTSVIYNPLMPITNLKSNASRNSGHLQVLCLERIEFRKGVDVILDALSHIDNSIRDHKITFHFCGRIMSLKTKVESIIKTKFENIDVKFYGNVETEVLANLLTQADIFLAPSRYETFSYTLFEAMSAGLPILASNAHVNKEFLKKGVSGILYDDFTVESFVDGFKQIVRLDRKVLGNNAYEEFLKLINLELFKSEFQTFAELKV